jgi:hypothetical protein
MPKETITITVCEMEWYLAGAQFVSALAYPDQRDVTERSRFEQALVRWTLRWRMNHDPKWATEPQAVRPAYFSGADKEQDAIVKRGDKRFQQCMVAAYYLAVPHFKAVESGKANKRQWHEGFAPTVENMSLLAVAHLKLSDGSASTFKSRIWARSKPVIHAAAALHFWGTFYWKKEGRNPDANTQMVMMMLPEYVAEIVAMSEELRAMLPQIAQFKINESDTVKFEAVETQNSGEFLQLPRSDPSVLSSLFEGDDNAENREPPENTA